MADFEAKQNKDSSLAKTNLLKYYRFDNFISGENNNFPLAFAKAVSESPGKEYNPLFVYSNVGLGKTHLLNALGNEINDKFPDKKIYYISSQQFEAELVESIQSNRIDEFRSRYTELDVLLIDDIQFIASRESAQQEFFHAFNELFIKGKQIVLSSDRPPSTLSTLEHRIRSRFEGGIITEILQPGIETRKAILMRKLQEKSIILPDEVIDILCENIKEDIRKLEGALKELIAFSKLAQKTITPELAQKVLRQKMQAYNTIPPIAQDGQNYQQYSQQNPNTSIVNLESPNDSVSVEYDEEIKSEAVRKPLKINISLPPSPKKKQSLIKLDTKNIPFDEDDLNAVNSNQMPTIFGNKPAQETIKTGTENDNNRQTAVFSAGNKPPEAEQSQRLASVSGNISAQKSDEPKIGAQPLPAQGESNTDKTAGDEYRDRLIKAGKEIDEGGISLTTLCSSQSVNKNPVHSLTSESDKTTANQPSAQAQQNQVGGNMDDAISAFNNKLSLTNIFSSKEVKEKINKIIAVGNSDSDKNDDILGAAPPKPNQSAAQKNVFDKEHKKKLSYELSRFDKTLKDINRGKIKIYFFEALDDFTKNLEYAHEANAENRYLDGLNHIRNVKKALSEMVIEKENVSARQNIIDRIGSQKLMLIGGLAGITVLICFVLWYILFGNY